MDNKNKMRCRVCSEIVGEYVQQGGINSPLGFIPCYDAKLDRKKASKVYYDCRQNKQIPPAPLSQKKAVCIIPSKKKTFNK